jgi:hypothetical protein
VVKVVQDVVHTGVEVASGVQDEPFVVTSLVLRCHGLHLVPRGEREAGKVVGAVVTRRAPVKPLVTRPLIN